MAIDLFTYGTLISPKVWLRVVGRAYPTLPARVRGFRRVRVRGESYPALLPAGPEEEVEGVVHLGLSPQDLARIDRYEGELYRRIPVTCHLQDGSSREAQAYLFRREFLHLTEEGPWDPEEFLKEW